MLPDAIDLTTARLGSRDSIDVRAWPIITAITRLTIHGDGRRMAVIPEFAQAKAWPRVPNVEGGPINWTLWMGHQIAGGWQVLAICTCVDDDYVPTGPVLQPGHIVENLYYYADAPYQPAVGQATVFFITSGCTRRANTQGIAQPGRSQVVQVPLQAGTWSFSDGEPVTTPIASPTPTPTPIQTSVQVPAGNDRAAILELSKAVEAQTEAIARLQSENATAYATLATKADVAALRQEAIDTGNRVLVGLRGAAASGASPSGILGVLTGLFGRRP